MGFPRVSPSAGWVGINGKFLSPCVGRGKTYRRSMAKGDPGTGVKLVDGEHVTTTTFEPLYYAPVDHYLIEVYDGKHKAIGQAITEARGRYLPDTAGTFVHLKCLGSKNEHYQWYIDNEGKPGGLPGDTLHHFCKPRATRTRSSP